MTDKPKVNVGTPGHCDWSNSSQLKQNTSEYDLLIIPDILRNKDNLIRELREEITRLNNVLTSRIESDKEIQNQNLKLLTRLCKYEGHLPITDHEGKTWCELCQEKIEEPI